MHSRHAPSQGECSRRHEHGRGEGAILHHEYEFLYLLGAKKKKKTEVGL